MDRYSIAAVLSFDKKEDKTFTAWHVVDAMYTKPFAICLLQVNAQTICDLMNGLMNPLNNYYAKKLLTPSLN